LRQAHQAILADEPLPSPEADSPPTVTAGGSPPAGATGPVPAQLPLDVPGFTGRDRELARLHEILSGSLDPSRRSPTVALIAGTAGVGKTALAVHFGHQVAELFPDGQLYVNLRGFDPHQAPLSPGDVLGRLLRSLGVHPQQIPADVDELAARYRSLLA